MSFIHSNSAFEPDATASGTFLDSQVPAGSAGDTSLSRQAAERRAADRAIDAALRSVPLPDGLLTRLGRLVYTMPDETTGQVDWLGC
jgi:hypothetical protein